MGLFKSKEEKEKIKAELLNEKKELLISLAKTHWDLEKYEEALRNYDLGLEIDSKDLGLWFGRSGVLLKLKKYEDLIKNSERRGYGITKRQSCVVRIREVRHREDRETNW
jgi:tetratricopeptide (TPR) repeat protein